jgi:bile acid-coenzyme A ligase
VTSLGRAITETATARPDETALVFADGEGPERTYTWRELDRRSNQIARLLAGHGLGPGDVVGVALPNSPEHILSTIAGWKVGACVVPLRWDLPTWERDRVLAVLDATVLVADWTDSPCPAVGPSELDTADGLDDGLLDDRVPNPATGIATGGSTGTPKIVIRATPGERDVWVPMSDRRLLKHQRNVHLVASPLYHTNGFVLGLSALLCGDQIVLMARFDPTLVLDLIERYRIDAVTMVPTMLARIARVPGGDERDLSSLSYVRAGGGPCPPWLARTWIDLVGPDRFLIGYGASERIGGTTITGREWLDHPGSVGRPVGVSVRIVGDDGRDRPTGEVGDIYMRAAEETQWPPFEYRGAQPASVADGGFIGVGDVGWLDDDGYLYIADRRTDLIVSGGANVYPAEVEAALGEHPQVADVVVVGQPDPEWGQRVHAVVQPADPASPPAPDDLAAFCRARLAAYKIPKTWELRDVLPRTDAGKINRGALRSDS